MGNVISGQVMLALFEKVKSTKCLKPCLKLLIEPKKIKIKTEIQSFENLLQTLTIIKIDIPDEI